VIAHSLLGVVLGMLFGGFFVKVFWPRIEVAVVNEDKPEPEPEPEKAPHMVRVEYFNSCGDVVKHIDVFATTLYYPTDGSLRVEQSDGTAAVFASGHWIAAYVFAEEKKAEEKT